MGQSTLFVQVQGNPNIVEVSVAEQATAKELKAALAAAGVTTSPELSVFIDEDDEPVSTDSNEALAALRHGARVHVARCRRIKTSVHYLDKTIERAFGPGVRVHTVKKWAAHEFKLDRADAAEHVLQICGSSTRPASDTPLHTLAQGSDCAVCFDFVPEKRIEG